MKKFSLLLAATSLMAGCAVPINYHQRDAADPQRYTFPDTRQTVIVSGFIDRSYSGERSTFDGSVSGSGNVELTVAINGSTALRGTLNGNPFSGNFSGNVTGGKWQGHSVTAICTGTRKSRDWTDVKCPVLIDDQQVAELHF